MNLSVSFLDCLIVLIISILIIYGLVVHGDIRGRWGQPAG